MQEQEAITIVDLEDELKNDSDGARSQELKQEIFELWVDVKKHIDSGLPPEEYARYNKLKEAAETAILVLEKVRLGLAVPT